MTTFAPRRALVAGASGPIGRALIGRLTREGIGVARLVRRPPTADNEFRWDPKKGEIDLRAFDGVDAVFNLSGRSIKISVWTRAVRDETLQSRVRSTRLLVDTMTRAAVRPAVLVSASGIHFYGDRGDDPLTEATPKGKGFLSDVTAAWEGEAVRAEAAGIRVVCARTSLVLTREGGALSPMMLPFRLGLGGPLGSGRQWWSWIHIDDVTAALLTAARDAGLRGPVNLASPHPARNREFVRALGAALRRPTVLPVPAFALRAFLGLLADEVVLASARVIPERLQERGFTFAWPDLGAALKDVTR